MTGDANAFHFITRWSIGGSCGEVADVLSDPLSLVRWWPSVYIAAEELEPPDEFGRGHRLRVRTKGWLPLTLSWDLTVVEAHYPNRVVIDAAGDFVGRVVWTFVQDGPMVNVISDWSIRAERPLLRRLSWMLKPILGANHHWAMAQGEASLVLELQRRRAITREARASVPPPPGPVTYAGVALVGGAVAAGAGLAYLVVRARRRRRRR